MSDAAHETTITDAMIAAGEEAVLEEVGGADLGGYFSAAHLAEKVYRAMVAAAPKMVRVTREMADKAVATTDWAAIDAQSDEDIERNVASDPDAAPLSAGYIQVDAKAMEAHRRELALAASTLSSTARRSHRIKAEQHLADAIGWASR